MVIPLPVLFQTHAVFSALPQALKSRLAAAAIRKYYLAGEFLVRSGDPWPYLFLVVDGVVQAVKESPEGRSLIVAELKQGELFWGLAFFDQAIPNPVTLQVNQNTEVYLWERESILPILLENGRFSWELTRLMVTRMLYASGIIESLAFQPVAGRLAHLLLDHFASAGETSIERSLTLDEMAARVGTTREMVCRAIYRFADKGLIQVTRTEFVLTDQAGLRRVVEDS